MFDADCVLRLGILSLIKGKRTQRVNNQDFPARDQFSI